MKKLKFFIPLLLLTISVIHQCRTLDENGDKITFIESNSENDELERMRELIDEYRKWKESMRKQESEAIKETTMATLEETTPDDNAIRVDAEEEEEEETTTLIPEDIDIDLDDRYLLHAPTVCKDGHKFIRGRCRRIFN